MILSTWYIILILRIHNRTGSKEEFFRKIKLSSKSFVSGGICACGVHGYSLLSLCEAVFNVVVTDWPPTPRLGLPSEMPAKPLSRLRHLTWPIPVSETDITRGSPPSASETLSSSSLKQKGRWSIWVFASNRKVKRSNGVVTTMKTVSS